MTRLWHITISTVSRETAFRTEVDRRKAVRSVVEIGGGSLLLYGLVDDHIHDIARLEREEAGRIAQRLNCSLKASCGLPFEMSDIRPVNGRAHLRTLVRYVLTQPEHHELPLHPALWEGSCFQDLVGARWLGAADLILRQELPRLSVNEVMDVVGLPPASIVPARPEDYREMGLTRIAACAAIAVGAVSLKGRPTETVFAKRVTVQLAHSAGYSRRQISAALGWPRRSVNRHAISDVPPAAMRAARVRIALERAVARQAPGLRAKETPDMFRGAGGDPRLPTNGTHTRSFSAAAGPPTSAR